MKAVQTRCPQKALAVWRWAYPGIKAEGRLAIRKRPVLPGLSAALRLHRLESRLHRAHQ